MANNDNAGFMESLQSDPHFLYILISAAVWLVGSYIPIIGPIITTVGFAATCFTTAISALKRPAATAWPGVIAGVVIRIVASFIGWIPIIRLLAPLLLVAGNVLILFFVLPLAVQHGEEILGETLKKFKAAKEEAKEPEEPEEAKEPEEPEEAKEPEEPEEAKEPEEPEEAKEPEEPEEAKEPEEPEEPTTENRFQ